MHRGSMRSGRHSQTRGSPSSSMRPTSTNKPRRSYSPPGRRHSPKRGRPFLKKSRVPGRISSQNNRPSFGNKKKLSSSPLRKHSLSPRRKLSPAMKRHSSASPNRRGASLNRRTLSSTQHSPSKPVVRRSASPRRTDSRNHSNVRSHSSGGRQFRKSSPRRPTSRSPVSLKKPRKLSPRWHSSNNDLRKKDTSQNADIHFKDGRNNNKMQRHDSRVDNILSPGRSHDFPSQRDDPPFNTGDIDERFQRQASSPYKKDDRFANDGAFRDNSRGYTSDVPRDQDGGSEMHGHNFMSGGGGGGGGGGGIGGGSSRSIDDDYMRRDSGNSMGESTGMGKLYTQEELKKITVDIYRSVPQDGSASKRNNFNPSDVVVVRRTGEGQRPIFDRDEIRQAQLEKGEACFSERRVVAIMKERSRSRSPQMQSNFNSEYTSNTGREERENFMINTEHFNSYGHNDKGLGNSRPSLNDRWQKLEGRNLERSAPPMGNNHKSMGSRDMGGDYYERDMSDDYSFMRNRNRSCSPSPNSQRFSTNRYRDRPPSYINERERRFPLPDEERDRYSFNTYDEDSMQRQSLSSNPHDLRHSLSTKRRQSQESRPRGRFSPDRQDHGREWDKERDFQVGRQRIRDRGMDRSAPDSTDNRNRDMYRDGRSGRGTSWDRPQDRDARDLLMQGKLPNFSSRPDKYRYQEWLDKPDVVPKGPSYFEHDTRGEGIMREMRGRGFGLRGRGRGLQTNRGRGGFRGRISYAVNASRNKWSPNHWKHDMFETSPDRKPEQDNKPSSTTGNK